MFSKDEPSLVWNSSLCWMSISRELVEWSAVPLNCYWLARAAWPTTSKIHLRNSVTGDNHHVFSLLYLQTGWRSADLGWALLGWLCMKLHGQWFWALLCGLGSRLLYKCFFWFFGKFSKIDKHLARLMRIKREIDELFWKRQLAKINTRYNKIWIVLHIY